jgi:hypothetical protein
MELKQVQTVKDIANYAVGLANDIEAGIVNDEKPNAQLIAEFALHCAEVAVAHERRKIAKNKYSS